MRALDRILQRWRMSVARPYIATRGSVLDVGCADGALFRHFSAQISHGIGIDPDLPQTVAENGYRLIPGQFPESVPEATVFDAITMLAVLEHIPAAEQKRWASALPALLKPGGHLIITVPSRIVDSILAVLKSVRLIDGMSLEQHYGFDPDLVPSIFSSGDLHFVTRRRFQLGCNNLFVFKKCKDQEFATRP
jgi:2-polyprenyl-3-methyl-5-hydroxy-6-metoxy-1,4-benzoquinol methylase